MLRVRCDRHIWSRVAVCGGLTPTPTSECPCMRCAAHGSSRPCYPSMHGGDRGSGEQHPALFTRDGAIFPPICQVDAVGTRDELADR